MKHDCRVVLKCNFCGKAGHEESRCYQKNVSGVHGGSAQGQHSGNLSTWVVYDYSFVSTQGQEPETSQFVIDSGCTSHMIMDRSLFIDLTPVTGHGCNNANQSVSKVVAVGSVRMAVKDGVGQVRVVVLT